MQSGRDGLFNIVIVSMIWYLLIEKTALVFDSLKCAAKFEVNFGFVSRNEHDFSSRYYYAHENNTQLIDLHWCLEKRFFKKQDFAEQC